MIPGAQEGIDFLSKNMEPVLDTIKSLEIPPEITSILSASGDFLLLLVIAYVLYRRGRNHFKAAALGVPQPSGCFTCKYLREHMQNAKQKPKKK